MIALHLHPKVIIIKQIRCNHAAAIQGWYVGRRINGFSGQVDGVGRLVSSKKHFAGSHF